MRGGGMMEADDGWEDRSSGDQENAKAVIE